MDGATAIASATSNYWRYQRSACRRVIAVIKAKSTHGTSNFLRRPSSQTRCLNQIQKSTRIYGNLSTYPDWPAWPQVQVAQRLEPCLPTNQTPPTAAFSSHNTSVSRLGPLRNRPTASPAGATSARGSQLQPRIERPGVVDGRDRGVDRTQLIEIQSYWDCKSCCWELLLIQYRKRWPSVLL